MTDTMGERYVAALVAKDAPGLRELFDPAIDFRGLTPGQYWEADAAADVVDRIILGHWFEPTDDITGVIRVDTDDIGDRHRVGYRLAVTNADGDHLVEQQAYYETDGDHITWMRVVCAGFQPVE